MKESLPFFSFFSIRFHFLELAPDLLFESCLNPYTNIKTESKIKGIKILYKIGPKYMAAHLISIDGSILSIKGEACLILLATLLPYTRSFLV